MNRIIDIMEKLLLILKKIDSRNIQFDLDLHCLSLHA